MKEGYKVKIAYHVGDYNKFVNGTLIKETPDAYIVIDIFGNTITISKRNIDEITEFTGSTPEKKVKK